MLNKKQLSTSIKTYATKLGFSGVGITQPQLQHAKQHLFNWLEAGYHGNMEYMSKHKRKRLNPERLIPGTLSLISVRYPYFDPASSNPVQQLHKSDNAYISRYALGRDYHKIVRKKLQQLADFIKTIIPELEYRAFSDSAPVLETSIAKQAGLGFIGKNSLLINPKAGSYFFLGELFINQSLPTDEVPVKQGCGSCNACKIECPTNAIVADGIVDARRCISYLTIEYKGVIEEELRSLMGNRIYGCDDCQLVCPWNYFLEENIEDVFSARHKLDDIKLLELWKWTEQDFMQKFAGSPIRRIGYQQWLRNLAIGLGNINSLNSLSNDIVKALKTKLSSVSDLVKTHIEWAIKQQNSHRQYKVTTNSDIKPFHTGRYYIPKKKQY